MIPSSCLLCGSPLRLRYPHVPDPYTDQTFSIMECFQCGLGHTSPVPENLTEYYPPSYHGGRHGISSRYCVARRLRLLQKAVPDGQGKRLLDIGCGEGTFLLKARSVGWNVAGTELNPEAGRAAGLEVSTSLEEAIRNGVGFDCITLWHSLEHLVDPVGALRRATAALTPDGKLLIAVPDFGGLQARAFGADWLHLDVPRHLYHFTAGALARLLEIAGFEVIRSWHQEFEYDLLGWMQSALNRALPRPNVLFKMLTGKPASAPVWQQLVSACAAPLLAPPAVVAVATGTLRQRGGTLVVAARVAPGASAYTSKAIA